MSLLTRHQGGVLEPEALSMYSVCRRGALARSRTLCQGLWPFWLEESEGVLGYSGRSQKSHSERKPVGHSRQIERLTEPRCAQKL